MFPIKFLDPKNKLAFMRIFGTEKNKDILICFLNDILWLEEEDKIKNVTFQHTIHDSDIASIDVLCTNEKGDQIILEMQVSPQKKFEKGAQYYVDKAYSSQLSKKIEEGKSMIFINICDKTIFKDDERYLRNQIIIDTDTDTEIHFTFIELSKFKIKEIKNLTSLIDKWCYFFKHSPYTSEEEVAELIGEDRILGRAYEELNKSNWSEIDLNAYEKEEKRIMDQAVEDSLRTESLEKEKQENLLEELEKGKQKGRQERNLEIAKKMLLELKLDIEVIQKATGLSREYITKIEN